MKCFEQSQGLGTVLYKNVLAPLTSMFSQKCAITVCTKESRINHLKDISIKIYLCLVT